MKRTLNIFIALLVVDLLVGGAFWFGYSAINAKKDKETELRKELADEVKKVAQQAALRRALKQAEKERGALEKYFYDPGEESQIDFVSQIEGLGTPVSGVIVETGSLSLTTGGAPSFYGEISFKGKWEETYHFLRLLETFPARLIIRRFTAQSLGGSDTVALWSGSASVDLTSLKGN
ncbi:MAG: hypothetical protein A3C93_03865 [Candidatus Lloydbacteria bacterium RIFCSPHIGHO2_02_FULL_54_17]|uniref:Type 4 fimbrial biogenesis protein PilO n=1 Tax=Candidatus Lloydbacteria bacterium RIFCSPHIGHO2_02_FULL_54_17 TaxID=1798664 RepID=A0A1G2DJG7_9BACT|nr:MAG: hypothetical protein A2762_00275 [Candidatus Lloydbacteria bacterium RIFCSPHIGHO2_01_FULL_54_11]OGZ13010.1 MAG: hypothetical protein A3C93_03865 [Candidatus Lloydbacteria bacterium RIFCSPHIGHO2_02_FULL_54_17]OGZ15107.1 MAG: hypothetical protein A3H76_00400 [Candidatus Lloydbacteria bacterium RIFCSPLOWO2_02_FULL_54_12]OGZ15245.1 MAG: hypothetical protein A2948_05545 [Candidatus Lloydbacteria bacterium RIFCSPLOWO2_01_FULL_54_18]